MMPFPSMMLQPSADESQPDYAIKYVGGKTYGWSGLSTQAFDTSGLSGGDTGVTASVLVGDIVMVCLGRAGRAGGAPAFTSNPGFTLVADRANPSFYSCYTRVYLMLATADGDISGTFAGSGHSGDTTAAHIRVFRGATATLDAGPTYANTNDAINPPAITPATAGAMIVSVATLEHAHGIQNFTAYGGMENGLSKGQDNVADCTLGSALYREWTSGSYDPAAWAVFSANPDNLGTNISLALTAA